MTQDEFFSVLRKAAESPYRTFEEQLSLSVEISRLLYVLAGEDPEDWASNLVRINIDLVPILAKYNCQFVAQVAYRFAGGTYKSRPDRPNDDEERLGQKWREDAALLLSVPAA